LKKSELRGAEVAVADKWLRPSGEPRSARRRVKCWNRRLEGNRG